MPAGVGLPVAVGRRATGPELPLGRSSRSTVHGAGTRARVRRRPLWPAFDAPRLGVDGPNLGQHAWLTQNMVGGQV